MTRKYGVKTKADGKYHLVKDKQTEAHFEDAAFNTAPIGDEGLCGRLDASAKFPRVLSRDSMRQTALCADCVRLDA